MNPKDFYFQMNTGDGEFFNRGKIYFVIAPCKRFDQTGYLDCGVGKLVNSTLFPLGFSEAMEGFYKYNKSPMKHGRDVLLSLGFVEKKLV